LRVRAARHCQQHQSRHNEQKEMLSALVGVMFSFHLYPPEGSAIRWRDTLVKP
jgi:hypothetical protein